VNREVGFDIYIAERTMLDISLLLFYFKHVLVYFFIYIYRLFSLFSEFQRVLKNELYQGAFLKLQTRLSLLPREFNTWY